MKTRALVLLLGVLLLAAGCSEKSTKPEEEPTEDYALEASQTIGAEGGTLSVNDFSLTIPAGAFSSDASLKLYASSEDKPFGDCCVSRTFRLEGLPDECSQPLKVSIEYQGTLSDSSFIAVGEEGMVAGSDELETAYQMLSATDSTGCLHCELPASEGGKATPKAAGRHTLAGSSTSRTFTTASKYLKKYHFFTKYYDILVPSGVSVSITELADLLDETYKTFMDMGFSISYVPSVTARNFDVKNIYCKFLYWNRTKRGRLLVNAEKLTPEDLPKMRVMLGREILRVIQFTYDPNYPVMVGPAQQDYYWLNEATLSWCEKRFVPMEERDKYVPMNYPNNEMAPFNGMQAGIHAGQGTSVERARKHGWGMSPMIEYLSYIDPFRKDSVVYYIYRHLHQGQHPVEAVLNYYNLGSFNKWWHDFLGSYVAPSFQFFPVSCDVFTHEQYMAFTMNINSDDNTHELFQLQYPDLSGELFRIYLNHITIADDAVITAKVIHSDDVGNVRVTAYMTENPFGKDCLTFLKMGNEFVSIENVRELTDYGADIILLVTNSAAHPPHYTQNSDIELEIKVTTEEPEEPEESWSCQIWFELDGYFRNITTDLYNPPDTNYGWREWWPNWGHVIGTFSENEFDVDWDTLDANGDPYSGSMRVIFNADRDSVKSLVVNAEYTREYCPAELSLTAWDIPLSIGRDDFLYYVSRGQDACDNIKDMVYRRDCGYTIDTLLHNSCNAESYMSISFGKIE